MRYITYHDDLLIMKNNGKLAHLFGQYGVLTVGDATTHTGAGNYIDASDTGTAALNIQLLWPTDLDAATTDRLERAGLGSLTGYSYAGNALTNLEDGWRNFFEAPILTGTTDVVSDIVGIYYIVLSGSVIYNGTTYYKNETFVTASQVTATTGSGTFAVTFPPSFGNECDAFLDCQFKIKHTKRGDEPQDFFEWDEPGGFEPKDSLTCTDEDYVGWIR